MRNVDNIHLAVYKADDTKREHPIFEQGNESEKKPITAGGLTIEVESFMLVVGQEKTKTIRSFRMGNTNTFLPTVQVLLEQNLKKSF